MKTTTIITTLFLFLTLGLFAQETLTLEKWVQLALENNYGIQMAKNTAEMSANSATAGNAGLLPSVSATAGVTYTDAETLVLDEKQNYESTYTNAGLSLSYTLFDGMSTINNFKSLKLTAENGELQAKLIIENTIVQVINSYYLLAQYSDNTDLMKEMLDISAERLQRAEAQKEFGTTTSLNVLSAKVDFNNDSISYIKALSAFSQAKQSFNALLGVEVARDFEIEVPVLEFSEFEFEQVLNSAEQNNTAYQMTQLGVDQSVLSTKMATSSLYPRVSLSSSYGYNQSVDGFSVGMDDPLMNFTTGITLSYNIFNGGQSKIQRQNAQISLENSQLQLDEDKLNLQRDIRNALLDYENTLAVLEAEKDNILSAEMNFEQAKEYYRLGQISSTQYRESQSNLIRAKDNRNAARYSAKMAETELKRLSGEIVESASK